MSFDIDSDSFNEYEKCPSLCTNLIIPEGQ